MNPPYYTKDQQIESQKSQIHLLESKVFLLKGINDDKSKELDKCKQLIANMTDAMSARMMRTLEEEILINEARKITR